VICEAAAFDLVPRAISVRRVEARGGLIHEIPTEGAAEKKLGVVAGWPI
jgi:hypothetical protein